MSKLKSPTIAEIREERALLKQYRKAVESDILNLNFSNSQLADTDSHVNSSNLVISSFKDFFNRFILKKKTSKLNDTTSLIQTISTNGGYNSVSSIINTAIKIARNPIVTSLFSRTKKSFIKWQLLSLGLYVAKKGYDYYTSNKIKNKSKVL